MNANTLKLTDHNFKDQVLASAVPVLVDIWAAWCGPCRLVGPMVDALADEFSGRVRVGKLNVDENPETASRYGVEAIPTLLFFQHGQVVDRLVGVATQSAIAEKLNFLLEQTLPSSQKVA